MAYEPLTPAIFKTKKPQFADVPNDVVQMYIDMASRFVDQTWLPGDYEDAWVAATCHLMTLDGLGTDEASKSWQTGAANYQSIRSGQLTLTRYAKGPDSGGTFLDWLDQTPCGKFYALLLRMNRGGPRILTVSGCGGPSGYAKDWPLGTGGWPSFWWSGQ